MFTFYKGHSLAHRIAGVCLVVLAAFGVAAAQTASSQPSQPASAPAPPASRPAQPAQPGGIYVVGQSHIDLAWLWRWDPETIEVCLPLTFGRAADCLEQIPEYRFSASQPPLFEAMHLRHPQLAARVDKLIRAGRLEPVGAHWVEFEGTGPSGESLVRQCVYGKRYFQEKYGLDVRNAWQIDAWSHPWTLPQILAKCDIDAYIFLRGARGERLFWWESADGSRVLGINPLWREDLTNDLKYAIEFHNEIKAKYDVSAALWLYGGGDHGGGKKNEEVLDLLKQMKQSPVPARFARVGDFVKDVLAMKKNWPVLHDELGWQLEGCHSNTCQIKAANRRCENLLIQAETFSSLAHRVAGLPYPKSAIKNAWLDVLFNQFHDIIGGAVVPAGAQDAMALYARVQDQARTSIQNALTAIGRQIKTQGAGTPVVVFNPLAWPRTGPVEALITFPSKPEYVILTDETGRSATAQILDAHQTSRGWTTVCLFIASDVPSLGYRTWWVQTTAKPSISTGPIVQVQQFKLENHTFAVTFDPATGDLASVFDKRRKIEILPENARANEIQILQETGSTEGDLKWGKERSSPKPLEAINGWTVVEQGPVRATVRIRNNLPESAAAERFVTLYANPAVPWIPLRTHFEWNGTDKMVKIAFPTRHESAKPVYDIPYGTITREPTGDERPAINWVDLSEVGGGVALLNDCRYGHDVKAGVIRLDALRSKSQRTNTEAGHQEVTYALYPHAGDWLAGRTMHRGYEFNNPLVSVTFDQHDGPLPSTTSFVTVERPNVILTLLKQAEDSDHLVARAYDISGEASTAKISLTGLGVKKATLTNLLEKPLTPVKVQSDKAATLSVPVGAYEIVTVLLE